MKKLSDLRPGEKGVIRRVTEEGPLGRRLLEMGLTPGTEVLLRRAAPLGDPLEIRLREYTLTLRRAEAQRIWLG